MPKNPKKARAKAKQAAAEPEAAQADMQPAEPETYSDGEADACMDGSGDASTSGQQQVFHPGLHELDEGEELDYDRTAYDCLHKWALDWPCLSFDVAKDALGDKRTAFPHTAFMVAGTQAAPGEQNHVCVMRLNNLTQGDHGKRPGKADSDDDSMSDSSDEEPEEPAQLHYRNIAARCPINRVRCMHQQPGIVATWGENSIVTVLNVSKTLKELAEEEQPRPKGKNNMLQVKPMFTHTHSTEGFALAWSRQVVGALAVGDCRGKLHTWEPREGGSWAVSSAYAGHKESVEDIEWSPTEGTVLATACVDKNLRIYDTRDRSKAQITVEAHSSDVNVLSWNTLTTYMLASGGDDGMLRVWDLRSLDNYVASFNYHKKPVCGIEWCPHECSMLATCSEDNSVAVWDLALERDPEEEARLAAESLHLDSVAPAQLLFLHAGQTDIKEVHWHPQVPGLLVSTAGDCFNIFKPSNIFEQTDKQAAA